MNRDQVKELFQLLISVYPRFKPDGKDESEANANLSRKVDAWARLMRSMDYKRVMAKAEQHISENKFPPTVAEIAAYAPEKNENLEKIKRWEAEAKQVTPELKEQFRQEFQKLLKDKKR